MDGRFPNHHPDPTVPKILRLVAAVQAGRMGITFDGDSDRIGQWMRTAKWFMAIG
jgi:phosphomannomutase